MTRLKILLAALLVACSASATQYEAVRDSLKRALPTVHTAADSLRIYYDLFDTAPLKERTPTAHTIYNLAVRSHNITAQLDMLRHLSAMAIPSEYTDSTFVANLRLAKALPESDMQRETVMFINMMRVAFRSREANDSLRTIFFQNEIKNYVGDERASLDEQILHHFTVCIFLGASGRGALLAANVDNLGELVRRLPYKMESVRNTFFTQAGRLYTQLGETRKAVEVDRDMLVGMQQMQERYIAQGRKYRNYDTNVYSCLRRMLTNYRALSPEEVDSVWAQIQQLTLTSDDVRSDLTRNERPYLYYLLAKGKYAEAIPVIKRQLDNKSNAAYRTNMLAELVEAAQKVGDNATMLEYMPQYIKYLESRLTPAAFSEVVEKEVAYRMSEYERTKARLDLEVNQRKETTHRIILGVCIIGVIVLLTFLVLMYRLYHRARLLSEHLTRTNAALTEERDKLQRSEKDLIAARDKASRANTLKNDFINNMSREVSAPLNAIVEYSQFIVDNMDTDRRKYMQKFADVVTLSADLLATLINDVLNTSSIENENAELTMRPVSVKGLCNMALANVQPRMQEGVKLIFDNEDAPDTIITTDPDRVDQVLINLLLNAAKFTEQGSVSLAYKLSTNRESITFSVTDTGIGIPEGKEKLIFERFEKLDNHTQGLGLGLYICSLVARLMNGTVAVDTTYAGPGARFLFTIPTL